MKRQLSLSNELLTLSRFIIRRDRVRLLVWILSIVTMVVISAWSFPAVYQDSQQRQARAELMTNPATKALIGPGFGLDNYTFGAMMTQEMLPFVAITVAIMSMLLVIRHTRSDEAEGRSELTNAYSGSRQSILIATAVVVGLVNIIIGVLLAIGLGAIGVEDINWSGSWLFGAAVAATGLVFTAVAAVAAQLTQHPRGASGLVGLIMGGSYLLRALGDVGENFLSWLSPFGWIQLTKAYVSNNWWPLTLAVALSLGGFIVAVVISRQRDFGAGILQTRAGRRQASTWLNNPLSLVVKLQKTSLIAWSLSLLGFGAMYGTLAPDIEGFVQELTIFGFADYGSILEGFLGAVIAIFVVTAMIFVVTSISRLTSEESSGRGELILATPVSIKAWVAYHSLVATTGGLIMVLAATGGMAVSAAITLGDPGIINRLLASARVYAPVPVLVVGLSAALYAMNARLINLAWLLVAYSAIVWTFGMFLKLPSWLLMLSPLEHIPVLPIDELTIKPLALMLALGIASFAVGMFLVRRRDFISN